MKILIDNQVYENQKFGGISRYFDELQLSDVTIERLLPYEKRPAVKNGIINKFRKKFKPAMTKPMVSNKYNFYNTQLREREFHIFHPTYYDNYFLESIDKPFVLTVHDMIHEKYPEYFGINSDSINKRRLCEAAEKIIAISENTKKDIIEIFGTPEDKINVIYHSTNFKNLLPVKPKISIPESYILITGNRSIYKNFLTFLVAIAPLLLERKDLYIICTGPDLSEIEKKWIQDLGIEAQVRHYFCKNDNELVFLYSNAECFVFPSLYEGFGFPVLEAFACECPVVSSPGGSLREIAGEGAAYFDPKNILDMRQVINKVLLDEVLKKELVAAGKKRLNDFSWDKCREQTIDVYSQVLNQVLTNG